MERREETKCLQRMEKEWIRMKRDDERVKERMKRRSMDGEMKQKEEGRRRVTHDGGKTNSL